MKISPDTRVHDLRREHTCLEKLLVGLNPAFRAPESPVLRRDPEKGSPGPAWAASLEGGEAAAGPDAAGNRAKGFRNVHETSREGGERKEERRSWQDAGRNTS